MKRTARLALRNRDLLLAALRRLLPDPAAPAARAGPSAPAARAGPAAPAAPAERALPGPAARPAAPRPRVLELGSGTGEHLLAFARALPHVDWQPSDPDPAARASVAAWAAEARLANLAAPLDLDLCAPAWRRQPFDLLLCVNVLHVAPPRAGTALLDGAAALPAGGALLLYGPFERAGERPPRLARFHAELTAHHPALGIRPLAPLLEAAEARGLELEEDAAGVEEGDRLLVLRRR